MASSLERARDLLAQRLARIEPTLTLDDPLSREWDVFLDTATALAEITRATAPVAAQQLTTREMAKRMNIHEATLLRRHRRGLISPVPGSTGGKGSRLRWAP